MRFPLPDWLPVHTTPTDVETAVARARQAIRLGDDAIFLTGEGALNVAGAVASRSPGPVRCVRLAGAQSLSDARLLLGWALNLARPGTPGAARRVLSNLKAPIIIVDARGTPSGLFDELRAHLSPNLLEARWMVIIATGRAPTNSIGATLTTTGPAAPLADQLPLPAHALAWLLAGIPGAAEAAFACRVPGLKRQAIWPSRARDLREASAHSAAEVADALGPEFDRHLQMALGGPLPPGVQPADYLALRWVGRHATQLSHAAMATAAAARLALIWGMPGEAQRLINEALPRTPTSRNSCRALLLWARAVIALDTGDRHSAQGHFEDAASALREERNLALLATATRRWGERLFARGETTTAALHLRNARVLYRQLDDAGGVAATLRGAGDVAIVSGETLGAEALFEQADLGATTPIERVNLLLSQATLAIARGDRSHAASLLDRAGKSTQGIAQLEANLHRRRADMALREGEHTQALESATRARTFYTELGETAAAGRVTRLIADIHGARGALVEAGRWYTQAIHTQILTGDREGLRRSLTHAAALEAVSGDPVLARELGRIATRLEPS